ncbi:hypothetical protein G6F50_014780 [Rhizopus delemar]|uniref:Uncharacterized protein n=1 Tax=Rhizopus delemar TaxID=936053 RepID=A0A9P6Y2R0_9FUNG|nr:hypothetical protein G6F50_014780 [Rhizopus delemar]
MARTSNGWNTSPTRNTLLARPKAEPPHFKERTPMYSFHRTMRESRETQSDRHRKAPLRPAVLAVTLGLVAALSQATHAQEAKQMNQVSAGAPSAAESLTVRQQAIVPIGAGWTLA